MRSKTPILALTVSLLGAGATCRSADKAQDPIPPPDPGQAMAAEPPPVALVDLKGVDLGALPARARPEAMRLLKENFCYCGCPRTIAACLQNPADCSCVTCSTRMANFIVREFAMGAPVEEIELQLIAGFAEGYNGAQSSFPTKDQPQHGPADARYQIVEFADYRCPHCAAAFEVLDALSKKRDDVQITYFYFPLNSATESIRAAEAAEAARAQGKYWAMSRVLFRNQHALSQNDLFRHAATAGLDMKAFTKAMTSEQHRAKVLANKALGDKLGIRSTPAFFVNGRRFGMARSIENFELRLEMEADRGNCR